MQFLQGKVDVLKKTNLVQHLKTICLLCATMLLQAPASKSQSIVRITSSDEVSLFIKSDGSLWRGDFAHALAKRNERMQRLMNELKQNPHSRQAFEKLSEEGKHITSANFEPVDL